MPDEFDDDSWLDDLGDWWQDLVGDKTLYLGLEGEWIYGLGVVGAAGFELDLSNIFDSGFYTTKGVGLGVSSGVAIQLGYTERGLSGVGRDIDLNINKLGINASADENFKYNGASLGYGAGAGASTSISNTTRHN